MVNLKIWDKQSNLYPPVGGKLTPQQVFDKWGWTENPDSVVVITETGGVMGGIDNLEILKGIHGVTTTDITQAVAEIEAILNAPQPEPEKTLEERIASALEFQSMMLIPREGE